ncbi:MAG: hypothetical protein KME55_36765 [Nostoc indistinguendum CM1-VF10]|jgi:hypothetical protein|nr:hypothetical protein [Nostoc indistinguendum CM1-VF10]
MADFKTIFGIGNVSSATYVRRTQQEAEGGSTFEVAVMLTILQLTEGYINGVAGI